MQEQRNMFYLDRHINIIIIITVFFLQIEASSSNGATKDGFHSHDPTSPGSSTHNAFLLICSGRFQFGCCHETSQLFVCPYDFSFSSSAIMILFLTFLYWVQEKYFCCQFCLYGFAHIHKLHIRFIGIFNRLKETQNFAS